MAINHEFWSHTELKNKWHYISSNCSYKQNINPSQRYKRIQYTLLDSNTISITVCRKFFLGTMGFKENSMSIVLSSLKKKEIGEIVPSSPHQGKRKKRVFNHKLIDDHLLSFNPQLSHCKYDHCPHRLYLPSEYSVRKLLQDFKIKHPDVKCCYETYRARKEALNISFSPLENEKCEFCTFYNNKHKNCIISDCEICNSLEIHLKRYTSAKEVYQNLSSNEYQLVYTADMQKSLYLPQIHCSQKCLFSQRINTYNLTFAHIHGATKTNGHFAVIWHDAIGGKKNFHLATAYWKFIERISEQHPLIEKLVLIMDNCSYQNKNFFLFATMVRACHILTFKKIELKYVEPGHSYMAADSINASISKYLKKHPNIFNFNDFEKAVQFCIVDQVGLITIDPNDFFKDDLKDPKKNKIVDDNKEVVNDFLRINFNRGSKSLFYSTSHDESVPLKEFDFMRNVFDPNIQAPKADLPYGIQISRLKSIRKLYNIIPNEKLSFWKNLRKLVDE